MQTNQLVEVWKREEQQPFIGWDFSYLDNRMVEEQPPWSYLTRAAELMGRAASVVDMDTGGGERFLKLKTHWPQATQLGAMASTDFFVDEHDDVGGVGANFIVEWVAEEPVHEPVVEAVMLSSASNQGISFISPGRVISQMAASIGE